MQTPNEILKEYYGYDEFRSPQLEIIQSVLNGRDTLALMPTGGGKSVCFQVPALIKPGICVVVSPLIALMKDQVFQLKKRNIRAAAIFSGLSYNEIDVILDNCVFDHYKFLYVSPERLKTELFIERFKKMNVNLLAVDEAHCISQWGYDFRPSYMEIAAIKKHHPKIPVLALTASATTVVQKDIIEKLELKDPASFKKSFARKNLSFVVRKEDAKYPKLLEIIQKVDGSGIVYVRNRNKTKDVAEYLQKNKIKADFYHAGLKTNDRNQKQDNWIKNITPVIVCTNAFGMGIDKSDVRFVIHLNVPDSLEAYYQEAGRAGRDGKLSYAALLYMQTDLEELKLRSEQKFPPVETIKSVYNALCNHLGIAVESGKMQTFDFDIMYFSSHFKLDPPTVYNSLKVLEQEGYLQLSEGVMLPSRVVFRVDKLELYTFEVAHSGYALLIKTLLRSYGGIMDHYTKISELKLAKSLSLTESDIITQLKFLQKNKILTYIPANDKPAITLLTERMHENNLYIDVKLINRRKNATQEQLKGIINFVQQKTICRQVSMCNYFGETDVQKCRRCDVCLEEKKKLELNKDFQTAKNDILQKTAAVWTPAEKLLPENAHFAKELYKDVIRFLLDEKLLIANEKNELKRGS
ncbi:MAG: ATP-dependent helicase RecQ [Bacteroidota bacterium]|nr:ATP-dependent helicase RecQ [Bacteroidota bacterium]